MARGLINLRGFFCQEMSRLSSTSGLAASDGYLYLVIKTGFFFGAFSKTQRPKKLNFGDKKLNASEAGQFFCPKTQSMEAKYFANKFSHS